jgi:CHRD domain
LVGFGLVFGLALTACMTALPKPSFEGTLSSANEFPALPAPLPTGTGTVTATLDGTTLTLTGSYSGLTGAPTAAHIHGPAALGASAGVLCNLQPTDGATAGTGTVSASGAATNPCSGFVLSAQNITDLNAGNLYVNIHTTANKNGEVRAQLIKK